MNISELLSTPEKERVLRRLLYSSSEASLRQTARQAGVSAGQVHKYLSILRKRKLATGKKLNDAPLVKVLRLTENVAQLENIDAVGLVRSKLAGVEGIGLYGSWAKGTNDEKSDVDLWVVVKKEPSDLAVAKTRRLLEEMSDQKVDLTILTPARLAKLKVSNPVFYSSLFNSLKLWGGEIWSI